MADGRRWASYLLFPPIPTAHPPQGSEIWCVPAGLGVGLSLVILWSVSQAGGSCEMFRWSQRYLWYLMEGSKAQFLTRKRRTQHSENTTSTWDEEPYFGFTVSMLYNSFVHGTSLEPGWGSFNSLSPSQCSSSPFPILAPLSFEYRDLGWLETLGFPVV